MRTAEANQAYVWRLLEARQPRYYAELKRARCRDEALAAYFRTRGGRARVLAARDELLAADLGSLGEVERMRWVSLDELFPDREAIETEERLEMLKARRHPFHMSPVIGCSSCEAIDPGIWRERYSERYEGE